MRRLCRRGRCVCIRFGWVKQAGHKWTGVSEPAHGEGGLTGVDPSFEAGTAGEDTGLQHYEVGIEVSYRLNELLFRYPKPTLAFMDGITMGGGVGIGYSLHAGMVVVADGTELAAQKLERVLTTDPGMDHTPVWSHDGRRIFFDSHRHGPKKMSCRRQTTWTWPTVVFHP